MTRVLIRCDIGSQHGMAHAVRCRALARALAAGGATVLFVTATPELAPFVAPLSCYVGSPYTEFLYLADAADVVVFDQKDVWVESNYVALRESTRVVRIDAQAEFESCDLLVFPNAHQAPTTIASLHAIFGERLLAGWDYVILDPIVTQQAPVPYAERQDGPIVFCAGGSDPTGALRQMYHWGAFLALVAPLVFLVGQHAADGPMASDSHMRKYATVEPFDRRWLHHAALVVTMFGITAYECAYWRTPVVTFARTEEDAAGIQRLAAAGINVVPGDSPPLFPALTQERFCATVEAHCESDVRAGMHAASAGLIDGHGTARVADAIMALAGA